MRSTKCAFLLGLLMLTGCSKDPEEPIVTPTPKPALQRELAALKDPTLKMARAVTSGKPGA
ncbi:MAG TPA: hypothetical protein VJS42_06195, partial [Steroidobacteraceae bacterium]|nr:hypothetical protein [Steroidobacteraceae bacterium]